MLRLDLRGVGRKFRRGDAWAEPDGELEELGEERVERRHCLMDGERLRQEVGECAHVLAPLPTQVRFDLDPALQQGFEVSWTESPQMGGERRGHGTRLPTAPAVQRIVAGE